MRADRVYKNFGDSRRVRVYKHESGEGWDMDVFRKNVLGGGWSVEAAYLTANGESPERTRKGLMLFVEDLVGEVTEIDVATVTEGWPEKIPPKPTKDAHIAIEVGQVWRQGSRRLRVRSVGPHGMDPSVMSVEYMWIDESSRSNGVAIVGRRARQHMLESRFRARFRHVREGS